VLTSGPLRILWDEGSTWYISYDQSVKGRESVTFNGLCGNFDGNPYSMLSYSISCGFSNVIPVTSSTKELSTRSRKRVLAPYNFVDTPPTPAHRHHCGC